MQVLNGAASRRQCGDNITARMHGVSCYLQGMQPAPWPHQGVLHLQGWAEECLVAIQMAVVGVVAADSSGSSLDGS